MEAREYKSGGQIHVGLKTRSIDGEKLFGGLGEHQCEPRAKSPRRHIVLASVPGMEAECWIMHRPDARNLFCTTSKVKSPT